MAFGHVPASTPLVTMRKSPLHVLTRLRPCPTTVSFDLSVVPVTGAFALWTMSAANTSADLPPDAVCSWQVSCAIDYVTVFNHETSTVDLAPIEISGTCSVDITYIVFLIVHDSAGNFCGLDVQNFTAPFWDRDAYPTISAPEVAAAYSNDGSIPGNPGFIGPDFTLSGPFWFSDGVPFLLGARIDSLCGWGGCSAPHIECDNIGRGGSVNLFPIKDGFQRGITYSNKTPNDVSPFGTYELTYYDPILDPPPATVTI